MDVVEIKKFVEERILELLHKETLDTYRVRNNNAFTSLIETRDIIQRCSEMKVKTFETVKYLANETVDSLRADTCLTYSGFDKGLLISEIEEFLKKNADKLPAKVPIVGRVLFCIDKCIEENKDVYLSRLLSMLDSMLTDCSSWSEEEMTELLGALDEVLSSLCVQLIYEGYSKQYLYVELKYRAGFSFDDFYKAIKGLAKKKKKQFEVIWKLYIKDNPNPGLEAMGFHKKANTEHLDESALIKYKKKLSPGKYTYFYQNAVSALDKYAATRISREKLMECFDGLHLGVYSRSLSFPDTVIILEKRSNGWNPFTCVADYHLDGSFVEDYALSAKLITTLDRIYRSSSIDKPAKDRIRSAIRHLNYGDLDSEIEQRFINYWIALEFVFASPHTNENTFTRLKDYLVDILSVSYVHRNVDYLKSKLVDEGFIGAEDDPWESKEALDLIADKKGLPLIWRYKLKKMKSRLFIHTDKLKKYYNNHITNLERHIVRIYNLRNVLVHEGAIVQDVGNLASNLRYYLVFMLDQMIAYFASHTDEKGKVYQIDDFFNEYISYRKIIESDFKLKTLLSIPVNKELW